MAMNGWSREGSDFEARAQARNIKRRERQSRLSGLSVPQSKGTLWWLTARLNLIWDLSRLQKPSNEANSHLRLIDEEPRQTNESWERASWKAAKSASGLHAKSDGRVTHLICPIQASILLRNAIGRDWFVPAAQAGSGFSENSCNWIGNGKKVRKSAWVQPFSWSMILEEIDCDLLE